MDAMSATNGIRLWGQLERTREESLDRCDGFGVGLCVVDDRRSTLDTGIVQRERLSRLTVEDLPSGAFFQRTPPPRLGLGKT